MNPLRVLIVEDSAEDAELILHVLVKAGHDPFHERVESDAAFLDALDRSRWDLVIADFDIPGYDGLAALATFKKSNLDIPFLLVSGVMGEEAAVAAMRSGAHDCIMKGNLARLAPAVRRELDEAEVRRGRRATEMSLAEANALNELLLKSIPFPLEIVDREGYVLLASDRMQGLAGDDCLGRKCWRIVRDTKIRCSECPVRSGLDAGETKSVVLENVFGERTYLATLTGMQFEGRDAVLEVFQDISEQKALEDRLRQSQRIEAVGRLASGVAHDFSNLLTAIIGYSQLIGSRVDGDDPIQSATREILETSQRAAALTRQLLAFSRKQVLRPRVLNVNVVVSGLERMLRRLIPESIEIAMHLAPEARPVKVDPGQLEQVIMNLVVNSRDAMPDGGRILIETENVLLDEDTITEHHLDATPGPCVMLAVSDTGIGMDRETCSSVFEPFFTTKEESGGTGLGLSTVYGIVKQSEGSIWLYSEPGLGTTFKIYLPAVMEEEKKATVEKPVPGVQGGTESVLVVEDDDSLRRLACKVLSQNGYTVFEAARVEAAVQLIDTVSDPVDLIITDVVMPGMNGVELADRIAERFPDIRVLFISGYTDHAVLEHGILDSGRPFLQKPFALNDLLGKVRETLDG